MKQCSLDRTGPSYSWMVSSCGHLHKTWTRPSHSAFHHGGKAQESTWSTEELWTANDILGRKSQFSLRCGLEGQLCSGVCSTPRSVWSTQIKVECEVLRRWGLGGVSGGSWG